MFVLSKSTLLYAGLTFLSLGGVLSIYSLFGTHSFREAMLPISMSVCILGISFLMKALIPFRTLKLLAQTGWVLALVYAIGFGLMYYEVFPESVFLLRVFMAGSLIVLLLLLANIMVWIRTPGSKTYPFQ
jgi:hypothetical protein